jgi:hypothetical protein
MIGRRRARTTGVRSNIFLIGSSLVLTLALPIHLGGQIEATPDRSLSIISVEGPKEKDVRAIAVGEGAAWILTKDQLLRIDSATGKISTLPAEVIKTWSRGFNNAAIGARALWASGEAHKIKGVHRIDLQTARLPRLSRSTLAGALSPSVKDLRGASWAKKHWLVSIQRLTRYRPTSTSVKGTCK